MNQKSIIILAAGQGTRMKSDTPKVLHKISGKPMLYYSIKEALKLSDDITVVLYHQFEKVKTEIEKYFLNRICCLVLSNAVKQTAFECSGKNLFL